MKGKPEKKVDYDLNGTSYVESITQWEEGYNQALDDYESFLPDKGEIIKIMERPEFWTGMVGKGTNPGAIVIFNYRACSEAIAKRIGLK